MANISELSITKAIADNRKLFEDVAKKYDSANDTYAKYYTILNYDKILDELIEYLDGYRKYTEGDNKKYDGKVLTITHSFFDKMFSDKAKYRKKIQLRDFTDISTSFLRKTKELKKIMEDILNTKDLSAEMHQMVKITDNQYRKVARVHSDDMKIYLWLTTADSPLFSYSIDSSTRSAYNNPSAPVMHEYRYNRG